MNRIRTKGTLAMGRWLILSGTILMTGCLFTVDSDRHVSDAQWSDHEVARIEPGRTSEAWVRTTFGEPERRTEYEDGASVWHYESSNRVDTEVGLFLLFHIDVDSREEKRLSIELRQGVVTDYWVENRS